MGKQQPGVRDGTGSFSREVGVRKQLGEECPFEEEEKPDSKDALTEIDEKLRK